jgi:hypothetical protein
MQRREIGAVDLYIQHGHKGIRSIVTLSRAVSAY